MEYKRTLIALVIVGGALSSAVWPLQERPKAGAKAPSEKAKPLIRKDLLVFEEGDLPSPLRNIFRPKSSPRRGPVRKAPVVPKPVVKAPPEKDQPPEFTLDLSYIGSVQSGGVTMALVMRSGQAVPVAAGEEIIPGYRIVRITPQEIEVEGPGAQRKTFSRQGGW